MFLESRSKGHKGEFRRSICRRGVVGNKRFSLDFGSRFQSRSEVRTRDLLKYLTANVRTTRSKQNAYVSVRWLCAESRAQNAEELKIGEIVHGIA